MGGMPSDSSSASAVGVVTVSFASDAVLPTFLASIPAASSHPLTVIVADNKPDDGTISRVVSAAGFEYLPMKSNLGYGGAINAAVRTLPPDVEWLVIGNPDVTVEAGAIDLMISRARSDARIALVGPQIVGVGGVVYPSARAVPSLRTGIGHALFANIWPNNPWSRAYHNEASAEGARATGWLSGAFFLARRSAFEDLGGFDEHFFMYFEDVDLGYRLGRAGWLNVYEPAAKVVHTGAHSTATDSEAMTKEHHLSARKFLSRKYSGWYLWPVRAVLTLGLILRLSFVNIRRRGSGRSTH